VSVGGVDEVAESFASECGGHSFGGGGSLFEHVVDEFGAL